MLELPNTPLARGSDCTALALRRAEKRRVYRAPTFVDAYDCGAQMLVKNSLTRAIAADLGIAPEQVDAIARLAMLPSPYAELYWALVEAAAAELLERARG